jgi:hypothetical protein
MHSIKKLELIIFSNKLDLMMKKWGLNDNHTMCIRDIFPTMLDFKFLLVKIFYFIYD